MIGQFLTLLLALRPYHFERTVFYDQLSEATSRLVGAYMGDLLPILGTVNLDAVMDNESELEIGKLSYSYSPYFFYI